jgi:hypothetical protein
MPKEQKTITKSRRSRPYKSGDPLDNESFEASSKRHDEFLDALQRAMDTWTIPEEDMPPTESILEKTWYILKEEPLGDSSQEYPFNVIRESAMMAIKGPHNRIRAKLTKREQDAYNDFLKILDARRLRIADEHFESVRRSRAAAERGASTEHECTGLNCSVMGGTRTTRKKTSMKSRPSKFTFMSRKSRGASLTRKESASRKSRRASTLRFYSRQKSRMSDQPLPKISLGESFASVEPYSVLSDAPDREKNFHEEREQIRNIIEKKEALKREEIEKYRLEQQRRKAEQQEADRRYYEYMEHGR